MISKHKNNALEQPNPLPPPKSSPDLPPIPHNACQSADYHAICKNPSTSWNLQCPMSEPTITVVLANYN